MPFGPWEIAILLLILVIIFGAGRLAQVGGALGKTVREFRGAVQDEPTAPPAPVAVSLPPVICAECRASNPATNKFCSACGATFRPAEAAAAPATAEPAPAPPAAPEGTASDAPAAHAPAASGTGEASEPVKDTAPIDAGRTVHTRATLPQNTCPSCATINPPGQPFCGQCGTRLKPAAA